MNTQIRPFTATLAEYNAIAAIHNAAWQATGLSGENRQRHDAGRNAEFLFQRLVAEIDGQIVAHAAYGENAWNHTPGKYFIEIAVHPDFQRRGLGNALRIGIATALKVCAIQFAQAYGARWIETNNEENNPLLQLNLRLGFQPAPAWLSFEERL